MIQVTVVMSKEICNILPADEHEDHWPASLIARQRCGKRAMMPV